MLLGELAHQLGRRPVGHRLGQLVPLASPARRRSTGRRTAPAGRRPAAPVSAASAIRATCLSIIAFLIFGDRRRGRLAERGLDQAASNDSGHDESSSMGHCDDRYDRYRNDAQIQSDQAGKR